MMTEGTGEKDDGIGIATEMTMTETGMTETGGGGGVVTALIMMTGGGDAIATTDIIGTVGIAGSNR
jgi:hypothetical protein